MEKRSPRSSDHRETQRCRSPSRRGEVQSGSVLSARGFGGHASPLSLALNSSQTKLSKRKTLSDINSLSPLLLWNIALIRSTENPGQREQERSRACYQQPQDGTLGSVPHPTSLPSPTPQWPDRKQDSKILLIRMTSKRTQSILHLLSSSFLHQSLPPGSTGGGAPAPRKPQGEQGLLRSSR